MRADRRALKQIALNLLSNAVKFTPAWRSRHCAGARDRPLHNARHCRYRHRHRQGRTRQLGRPFEQVESQLTKSHQGSGLGLAISKSLVELHGGSHAHPLNARQGHAGGGAAATRTPMPPAKGRGGVAIFKAPSLKSEQSSRAPWSAYRPASHRAWRNRARRPRAPAVARGLHRRFLDQTFPAGTDGGPA